MLNRKNLMAAALTSVGLATLSMPTAAWADATPECNNSKTPLGVIIPGSTECGENSTATGAGSTAIGSGANVTAASGTAVGHEAQANGQGVSVGARAIAGGEGTAIGSESRAIGRSVALGRRARAEGLNSIALGPDSFTKGSESNVVSIGSSVAGSAFQRRLINLAPGIAPTDAVNVAQLAASQRFISIFGGAGSVDAFANFEGTAIGANSTAQNSAVAFGFNSRAASFDTAIGAGSTATGEAVAVGFNSNAGLFGTAIGFRSFADGQGAVAIGHNARAENFGAIALGDGSFVNATAGQGIAIGLSARVEAGVLNGVALGNFSVASENNTVSVGASNSIQRRIVNLAEGTAPTDAVNLGQLNAAVNPLLVDVADLRTDISGLVPFLAFNTTSPVLASATGLNAMAIGSGSSASGVNSVAIGNLSNATQSNTFSVGNPP